MKKTLLTLTALTVIASSIDAQTKKPLYEEFTGENCGPCAASNPALEALMNTNASTVNYIRYQSPIPSAGPIYNLYPNDFNNRSPYYSVPFAPYGRLDGKILGVGQSSPGHVAYCTQTALNTELALSSSFNMTATHSWNATGDSVTATITVTCVTAFAPASASMKLRVALIEDLTYATAPGTNGETYFPHVVRRMYPDGTGTTIANAWTMGQSQTFTIKGFVPAYVNKQSNVRIAAFLQNDNDKSVDQSVMSTLVSIPLDIASQSVSTNSSFYCSASSVTVPATVVLKNVGTSTITSAKIYYKLDNGTYAVNNWTGSIAAGATANVSVSLTGVAVGQHTITDSVALPNNGTDINLGNSTTTSSFFVLNSTANSLPIADSFLSAYKPNWIPIDLNADGNNWLLVNTTNGTGHTAPGYLVHENYIIPQGDVNLLILPTANMPSGAKALDFFMGYRGYNAAGQDTLDIVYSTNCGTTWNTVWSKAGSALATMPDTTGFWAIKHNQWVFKTVDMSAVPTNSMIAFRAKSGYGNNLFIDDINLRTGPLSVKETTISDNIQLYPNPATDLATLKLTLRESSDVNVNVTDALGRTVITTVDKGSFEHTIKLNTSSLATGIYNVKMQTTSGTQTVKLTVTK